MRLDKDYLVELELWPHFEMRQRTAEASNIKPAPVPSQPNRPDLVPSVEIDDAVIDRSSPVGKSAQSAVADVGLIDPVRSARINALAWSELGADAGTCNACALCQQRQQVVFGVGPTSSPWMFVGEAPGAEEDQSGEPFVGQSGQLLDAMLQAAGLLRGRDVYITNAVKCRPPGNRAPTVEEVAACAPYLDRQIDLVAPKIIVALGKAAINRLTGLNTVMAELRGQVYQYRGIPVVATYHPSYLLRNQAPAEKRKVWEDMLLVLERLERPISAKQRNYFL